jgi:amino acid transporter
VGVVTVIYMLLTATLTLMVPISAISEDAAFAAAFDYVGYNWAKYIIALAALLGCVGRLVAITARPSMGSSSVLLWRRCGEA